MVGHGTLDSQLAPPRVGGWRLVPDHAAELGIRLLAVTGKAVLGREVLQGS